MPNLSLIHREMKEYTLNSTIILVTALLPRPNNDFHAFAVDTLTLPNLQTHHGSVVLMTSAEIEPGAENLNGNNSSLLTKNCYHKPPSQYLKKQTNDGLYTRSHLLPRVYIYYHDDSAIGYKSQLL